jgi:preprotein translocase subunit YajC
MKRDMRPGQKVRTKDGIVAEVLRADAVGVLVRLDGEATGWYPAGDVEPIRGEDS